ncbi:hypothetical protein ACET3Z_003315 [Daucus carota]
MNHDPSTLLNIMSNSQSHIITRCLLVLSITVVKFYLNNWHPVQGSKSSTNQLLPGYTQTCDFELQDLYSLPAPTRSIRYVILNIALWKND